MMDVRIFHPNADSYKNRTIDALYLHHENVKRKDYEQRVLQVFHQRLAKMVAEKRQERYGDVMSVMRTKLAFVLLRSVLISVRGARGKRCNMPVTPVSCTSFNLIPEGLTYDQMLSRKLD